MLGLFVEKSLSIILEPDFGNSRFHLFKTLANILDVLDLNALIETQGYLMEKIWLMFVSLIMADSANVDDTEDTFSNNQKNQQDDMKSVLEDESKQLINRIYKKISFNNMVKLFKNYLSDQAMADSIAMCISLCDPNDPLLLNFIKMAIESDDGNIRFIGCKSIFYLFAS